MDYLNSYKFQIAPTQPLKYSNPEHLGTGHGHYLQALGGSRNLDKGKLPTALTRLPSLLNFTCMSVYLHVCQYSIYA